jgi:signal peptidase I
MVFQYQYQYQYQLQRGLGLTAYDSFSQLLHDTYSNPVILSLLVAVIPLMYFFLRERIVKTNLYQTMSAIHEKRREEKQLKDARELFEENFLGKKRFDLSSLVLMGFIVTLAGLLLTKSLFFVAVTSDSMAPAFWAGDLVLIQSISRDYKIGDVVVFQDPKVKFDDKVIHRIKALDGEDIRTKGDNNNYLDDWILREEGIIGNAITLNKKPIVAKKAGQYFIENFDPFKEDDPTYQFLRRSMANVHTYGPIYLIVIILLILLVQLQQPERGKVY